MNATSIEDTRTVGVDGRARGRTLLWWGLAGSVLVCIGSFGVADIPRNHSLFADLGLAWMTYGHGKTLSGIVFWSGVATMVYAWVRLGRRITATGVDDADLSVGRLRNAVLLWATPLFLATPIYSRDVYAYLAQGAVLREGFNPYADGPAHNPGPLLDSMAQVWASTTAPYGPAFMKLAGLVTEVTGDHVIAGIFAMRLILLPGLFLALWALPRIASHFGASPQAARWLVLLNPLILIHLVGGPHVELLMMGVLAAGIALVLSRRHVLGLVVLGVAVSIKITAGIAIPFVLWIWLSHIRQERAVRRRDVARVFAAIVAITVAVFAAATWWLGLGLGWITGLGWADRIINWFTLPTTLGHLVTVVAAPFTALNLQSVLPITRAIGWAVAAVAAVCLWWWGRRDERSAVAGMAAAMLVVLVLEPSTLPWYYTWLLCIAVAFTLTDEVRMIVVWVSTFMLIVFQPDDSILFYKVPETLLAVALAALAAVSLVRRDPLRIGAISGRLTGRTAGPTR